MKIYYDSDADISLIADLSIVVVGYGNQGKAFALNMRDSGLSVSVALHRDSHSMSGAVDDGFPVVDNDDACHADLILMMLPDHIHGMYYNEYLAGKLREEQTLVFAHGYSVHFGLITPPEGVGCALVAPHGPGKDLRDRFTKGDGLSCFVGAHAGRSRKTMQIAVAIAKAVGATRVGAIKTTFEYEAIGDLFGEQALLCGGLSALTEATYDTLVDNGIPPENAYLETAHQLRLLAEIIEQEGIGGMVDRISMTAQFGAMDFSARFVDGPLRKKLQRIYERVVSGKFARTWDREYRAGCENLNRFKMDIQKSGLERTGMRLRKLLKTD
jgi:ketol-acid reductoisomerase